MVIVSDTSPLRYLVELRVADILPRLFGEILTTPVVLAELRQGKFPEVVRQWADSPPAWLMIESPVALQFADTLDDGEATALSLAVERQAGLILVDERKATRIARDCGMASAGTLAVLRDAAFAGLLDFHQAIELLTHQTEFRYTRKLIDQVVADFEAERRRRT